MKLNLHTSDPVPSIALARSRALLVELADKSHLDECHLLALKCHLLARSDGWPMGRACPLCPGDSDINLFGDRECVVNLDAEIADRAFDFGVAEQKLHSS